MKDHCSCLRNLIRFAFLVLLAAPATASLLVAELNGVGVGAYSIPGGTDLGAFVSSSNAVGGIAATPNGNILVSSFSGTISQYSASGNLLGTFAAPGSIALGLAVSPAGTVFADLENNSGVYMINEYGANGTFLGTPLSGGQYSDVAVAANGDLLVDTYFGVSVYDPTGTSLLHSFSLPQLSFGVAVDSNGDIYASSAGNIYGDVGEVYVCASCVTGAGSFVQLGTYTTTDSLQGLVVGSNNTLYVAGRFNDDVLAFNLSSGAESLFAANAGGAYRLAVDNVPAPEPATIYLSLFTAAGIFASQLRRNLRRKFRRS